MVNLRTITQKVTKEEAKDLLDKAQKIIKSDVLGDKFQGDKYLKKDKSQKSTKVKIDGEEAGEIVKDGELQATIKTKTKVPKPDDKADQILFNVKAGGKITPAFTLNNI